MHSPNTNKAFTLIELSIVLVVIGLVAGGVLVGQSLIKAAEIRSAVTQMSNFQIAANTFKDKYFYFPGDLPNATSFWGDNGTHCPDGAIADTTPGTCNGDGDGTVTEKAAAAGEESEGHMFWNHLMYAGLIEGTYTGIAGPANVVDDLPGENVPISQIANGCYHVDSNNPGNGERYNISYGRYMLEFGADGGGADNDCDGKLLLPIDAFNIDDKMDDGHPAYGKIIAKYWNNQCATVNSGTHTMNNLDARYKATDETIQCSLILKNFIN